MLAPDLVVARVAATQHGLFTRDQALAAGFTEAMIRTRVRGGRWLRAERGVWMIAGVPFTWHARVLSVCMASGGLASHRNTAFLLGADGFRPGPPEITVPHGTRFRRSGVRVHQSTDLDLAQPMRISSIPTTGPARLVVDIGLLVDFERFELLVHELIRTRRLTWDDCLDSLMAHARRGRNGVGPLRALLEESYGSVVPESALERTFERLLRAAGVEKPTPQFIVHDAHGNFIARLDYAYPDRLVAIELDSLRFHTDPKVFERDREKRNRLAGEGWFLLQFTQKMIAGSPDLVVRQVLDASRRPVMVPHLLLPSRG